MTIESSKIRKIRVSRDLHGTGHAEHDAYVMPAKDPHYMWSAITSYRDEEGGPVLCPVEGCGQELVWYEAGYVPGYRVCMEPVRGIFDHDLDSIRHRFVLGDVTRDGDLAVSVTLILDDD